MLVLVCAAGGFGQTLSADLPYSDDFEAYNAPAGLSAQSNVWDTWDNNPVADAIVNTEQAHSGSKSVKTVASEMGFTDSDLVLQLDDPSGNWRGPCYEVITYQYVPANQSGETYWIMQSIYNHGGPYTWAVQIHMNAATGVATADFGGETVPLKTDQWVELRLLAHFTDYPNDLHQVYYDGTPFYFAPISWRDAMNGSNAAEIGSLDWYANNTCCAYYDDLVVRELQGECNFAGETNCVYVLKKKVKAKKGCGSCPKKGDEFVTEDVCEEVKDCPKKLNLKQIPCPDGGRGFCKKINGKKAVDCR
ncbi:MAG: hypothetical protein C4547_15940 [Phycisphaerales bacterium]|nr:MAG: hypothetical protein C4547_15940 [Phycisphaerales bacterium]